MYGTSAAKYEYFVHMYRYGVGYHLTLVRVQPVTVED